MDAGHRLKEGITGALEAVQLSGKTDDICPGEEEISEAVAKLPQRLVKDGLLALSLGAPLGSAAGTAQRHEAQESRSCRAFDPPSQKATRSSKGWPSCVPLTLSCATKCLSQCSLGALKEAMTEL
jgi:hypothetical protein